MKLNKILHLCLFAFVVTINQTCAPITIDIVDQTWAPITTPQTSMQVHQIGGSPPPDLYNNQTIPLAMESIKASSLIYNDNISLSIKHLLPTPSFDPSTISAIVESSYNLSISAIVAPSYNLSISAIVAPSFDLFTISPIVAPSFHLPLIYLAQNLTKCGEIVNIIYEI